MLLLPYLPECDALVVDAVLLGFRQGAELGEVFGLQAVDGEEAGHGGAFRC